MKTKLRPDAKLWRDPETGRLDWYIGLRLSLPFRAIGDFFGRFKKPESKPHLPASSAPDALLFKFLQHFENDSLRRKTPDFVDRERVDQISTAKVVEIGYGFTGNGVRDAKRWGMLDKSYTLPVCMRKSRADEFLRDVIMPTYQKMVRTLAKVPLEPHQVNALAAFAFNLGESNLRRVLDSPGRVNSGNLDSVRSVLPLYRKSGGVIRAGLVRRRAAEVAMFYGEEVHLG